MKGYTGKGERGSAGSKATTMKERKKDDCGQGKEMGREWNGEKVKEIMLYE